MNALPPNFTTIGDAASAVIREMAWQVASSNRPLADRLGIAADLIGAGHRARDVDLHLDNVMDRARELRQSARGTP